MEGLRSLLSWVCTHLRCTKARAFCSRYALILLAADMDHFDMSVWAFEKLADKVWPRLSRIMGCA